MADVSIKDARDTLGIRFLHTINHDGLASYAVGGDLIPASAFGFKHIENAFVAGGDNGTHHCSVRITGKGPATSIRILWYVNATGVEVANAVNLSARFCRVSAYGR